MNASSNSTVFAVFGCPPKQDPGGPWTLGSLVKTMLSALFGVSPGLSWALLGSPGLSWALLGSPYGGGGVWSDRFCVNALLGCACFEDLFFLCFESFVPFVPLGVHFMVPASEGPLWLGSLLEPWVRKGDLPVTTLVPHPGPQFCLDVSAKTPVLLYQCLLFSNLFGARHGSGAGIRSPALTAFAPMRLPPGNTPRGKKAPVARDV